MVAFSEAMRGHDRALKAFLHEHMYRHRRVAGKRDTARGVVGALFAHYMDDTGRLPDGLARARSRCRQRPMPRAWSPTISPG